jgi:spectinomycin phosphotransferase
VYAEPTDLDRRLVEEVLSTNWSIRAASLVYEPVGFGTHHYVATEDEGRRWFVNVDDLQMGGNGSDADTAFDNLDRAFRTAVLLREAGLEFVHAPLERPGGVVDRLSERYALSVFVYVEGASNPGGAHASDEERRLVLNALGRIHAASGAVPPGLPRRDTLEIPLRDALFEALDDPSAPWGNGPLSDTARALLAERANYVREKFDQYDEIARSVLARGNAWPVTHGEPHGSNVMRTRD